MLFLKYLLMLGGIAMITVAAAILAYDIYLEVKYRQALAVANAGPLPPVPQMRWRSSLALVLLAWGPILLSLGIVVVPSGMAAVRVSQTSGTLPGALYPGAHFIVPLAENIVLFDTRDQLFTTGVLEDASAGSGKSMKSEPLNVQAKEGLDAWIVHHCAIPARSQAPGLHSEQPASAGRKRNCASRCCERVA